MSTPGTTTITLTPALTELPALIAAVEDFAELHEVPMPDSMALALAAEELFTNTVNHGNSPSSDNRTTMALVCEANAVTLTYTDHGRPFDTAAASVGVDTTLSAEARGIGGLGLHMIARTMESFVYERRDGSNITTIVRRLGQKKLAL